MAEQETYTVEQAHTVTYTGNPTKLQIVPSSNIDLKEAGRGTWSFEVEALDDAGEIVELAVDGAAPVPYVGITATLAEMKTALGAAAAAKGVDATGEQIALIVERACVKLAKAKLSG